MPRNDRVLAFGLYRLDLDTGTLSRRGITVRLGGQAAQLLMLLAQRAGEVVKRDEIRRHLWGESHIEAEGSINLCVHQIRRALGDNAANPVFIETLPGAGYRFIAPLEALTRQPKRGYRRLAALSLAAAIVAAVAAALLDREPVRGVSPQVRVALAESRFLLGRQTAESTDGAVRRLEEVVQLAPDSVEVWVALSHAYFCRALVAQEPAALEQSRKAAWRALELDPDSGEAHARLGAVELFADLAHGQAEQRFLRAQRLAPQSAQVLQERAFFLASRGQTSEAIHAIERAVVIDPVATQLQADAAWIYFLARRWDEALERSRQSLALQPDHPVRLCALLSLEHLERWNEALEVAITMVERLGEPEAADRLRGFSENPKTGLRAFRSFVLFGDLDPRSRPAVPQSPLSVSGAALYADLGLAAQALSGLERAADQRPWPVDFAYLRIHPQLDPLRAEPRFQALLEQLGL